MELQFLLISHIDRLQLIGLFMKIFFFISMANTVSEKSCCLIVWSWYQIITFWFSCYKLDIAIFSHVFYGFLKNCIVYQLEKKIIMDKY